MPARSHLPFGRQGARTRGLVRSPLRACRHPLRSLPCAQVPEPGNPRARRARLKRIVPALALLALTGLAAPAPAQSVTTFISNFGQARDASIQSGASTAQVFGTGSHSDGYLLSSVEVRSEGAQQDTFALSVCTVGTNGRPTSTCTPLTAPSSFAPGTLAFTSVSRTILQPSTSYALVFEPDGATAVLDATASSALDSGAADGWSLAGAYQKRDASNEWITDPPPTKVYRIAVKGTAYTRSTDTTAPALDTNTAVAVNGDSLVLTYDEPLDVFSSPAPSAFSVTVAGMDRTVARVTVSGKAVTLTLTSAVVLAETVTVSYTPPATDPIQDSHGNDAPALTNGAVTNHTPPFVTSVAVTSTPRAAEDTYGAGEDIEFTVTFSDAVEVSASPPHFEFQLGLLSTLRAEEAVYDRGSGTTALVFVYTVQAPDRDPNGIWVWGGNSLQFASGEYIRSVVNRIDADLTHPALGLQSGHKVDGSLTVLDTTGPELGASIGGVTRYGKVIGKDIHLYFNEPIDQDPDRLPAAKGHVITVNAFLIKVDGVEFLVRPGSVRGGAASNELVLADLTSPVVRGQTVRVAYLDPRPGADDAAAIQDLAGNDAKTFDFTAIENGAENTTGPRPIMQFVIVQRGPGNALSLNWGLFPTSHGADSYDVQFARWSGAPVPDSEWIDGPQGVTGTPGGHSHAGAGTATIENLDSATFYRIRVRGTNSDGDGEWSDPVGMRTEHARPRRPTLVNALSWVADNGADLRLAFYRDLDRRPGRIPSKDLFMVTADDAPIGVGELVLSGDTPRSVYLRGLSPAIRQGQTVRVSYRDPTPTDGTAVLQGLNGADVHSFSNVSVDNRSTLDASDSGVGPAPSSARVPSGGGSVIVAFDEDVDKDSIPVEGAFAVTVGGTEVTLSGVVAGDGANELRIETSARVVRDQTVRVSYSRPASGNVIRDPDGNAAESFADYPVDSTRAPQSAPRAPLTAAFGGLPQRHTGASFTVKLDFSEGSAATADRIRAGLTVTGGSVTGVTPAVAGETRSWNLVVTPTSAADAVTLALAPPPSCDAQGAICTADGRALSAAVEVEVPGREPTRVVSVRRTTDPGANGTWDTGETVEAEVAFNRAVAVYGPPGVTPTLGITLDGTRREATLTSTGSTATLTFSHTVTADDDGAEAAAIVASGITLHGTVIADNEGNEAELAFSPPPALAVADVSVTQSTDSTADFVVTLAPAASETVTVDYATSDGSAKKGVDYSAVSDTLTFDVGETTKTVSVPVLDDGVDDAGGTFTLTLRNASGAALLRAVATGTLLNTEPSPRVTGVELVADASGDNVWSPGERIEVRLVFSEAVQVHGGSPWLNVSVGGFSVPVFVHYASGSGSAVLSFSLGLPERVSGFTGLAVVADSLRANGARIVSAANGRSAELGHEGTEPTAAPGTGGSTPLSAAFRDVPEAHGGNAFTVELRFSEEFPLSFLTLRDHALGVTGGTLAGVSRARKAGLGTNQAWTVAVTPAAGAGDVTVTLAATTACTATGAICTKDKRPLAEPVSATVPRAVPAGTPFRVRFEGVPAEHAGSGAISFKVLLNKEPQSGYSYVTMRDATLAVGRGAATNANRLNPPRNAQWQITVAPEGYKDVTVSVGPFTSCTETGAVCAAGTEVLSNAVSRTILGPPGLSVADAQVEEAQGATLDFAVTLSRASSATVTVDYATSDGSARQDEDYTGAADTLTFAPGETAKTVSVAVLDDAIDDGGETLTLTLSNPSGGNAYLKDATATGTIANSDPMPRAWLARFGRTVASQAVDAIGGRMAGGGATHVTLAGQSLSLSGGATAREEGEALAAGALLALAGTEDASGGPVRSMTGREALLGSAFRLSAGGEAGAPAFTAWGQFASGGFDAEEDGTRMDGRVVSGFLGADVGRERWLAGLALSSSEGDGDYALLEGDDAGTVESSLTLSLCAARRDRHARRVGARRVWRGRAHAHAGGQRAACATRALHERPLDAHGRARRPGRGARPGRARGPRGRAQIGRVLGAHVVRAGARHAGERGGRHPHAAAGRGRADVRHGRRTLHALARGRGAPRRRRCGDRHRRRGRRGGALRGRRLQRRGLGAHAPCPRGVGLRRVGRLGRRSHRPRGVGPGALAHPRPDGGGGVERRGAAVVAGRGAERCAARRVRGPEAARGRARLRPGSAGRAGGGDALCGPLARRRRGAAASHRRALGHRAGSDARARGDAGGVGAGRSPHARDCLAVRSALVARARRGGVRRRPGARAGPRRDCACRARWAAHSAGCRGRTRDVGTARPLWRTGMTCQTRRRSLHQPGSPQIHQAPHPRHGAWWGTTSSPR